MLSLCRTLLRDPTEADDALQATFLSAFRSLGNGTVPREPGAWLAAIARNECWSRVRARMREPLAAGETEEVSGGADPVVLAIRNEDVRAFWAAFSELPRPQQQAFLLREFHGLSYDELALALGVSGAAVESLLFRARCGLRTALTSVVALPLGLRDLLGRLGTGAAGTGVAVKAATATIGIGLVAASTTGLEAHHPRRHSPPRPVTHSLTRPAAAVTAVAVQARPAHAASGAPTPAPHPARPRARLAPVVWHPMPVAAHGNPVAPGESADEAPSTVGDVAVAAPTREEASTPTAEPTRDHPDEHPPANAEDGGGVNPVDEGENGGESQG